MTKRNNNVFLFLLFIILVHCLIAYFAIWITLDNDFYHIANSGKLILQDAKNLYYNTEFVQDGYRTIIQQWLYSIMIYKSYELGGLVGVNIFTTVQYFGLIAALYAFLRSRSVSRSTAILGTFLTPLFIAPYICCRPQMISLVLFLIQFIVLEKYKSGNKKCLYLLPILTLLQANLHLTFTVFHFVFLLPYIVPIPSFLSSKIKPSNVISKDLIVPVILMLITSFVNPYGAKVFTVLFDTMSLEYLSIKEMQPLSVWSEEYVNFIVGFIFLAVAFYRKKLSSTSLYFVIGNGILYALAIRNCLFFFLSAMFAYGEFAYGLKKKTYAILSIMLSVMLISLASFQIFTTAGETDNRLAPQEAVQYVLKNKSEVIEPKIFTTFGAGGYFSWNDAGKIYFNSKTEPFFKAVNRKENIIDEYACLMNYASSEYIDEFLNKYEFDYLYVDYTLPALDIYLSMSPDYRAVVVSDSVKINGNDAAEYKLYEHIETVSE